MLKDLIKEAEGSSRTTGPWDPDVHPPAFQGHFGDEDDWEMERQMRTDDEQWELEWEAENTGRNAADRWLSSGTDYDADEWIERVVNRHRDLDADLIRKGFDDRIDRSHVVGGAGGFRRPGGGEGVAQGY